MKLTVEVGISRSEKISSAFPIRREGLNEGRVQSKEQDDVGPTIFCNAVGSDR